MYKRNPFIQMDTTVCFMNDAGLTAKRNMSSSPTIGRLAETKKFALRRRIWFSTLSRVERGIIDLTIKYVDRIQSITLAKVVTAIIVKLQCALESIVDRLVKTVGLPLVRKISDIAVSWGNHLAFMWADDCAFARFLVFNFVKIS
jgi:hypothetical protein